MGHHKLLKDSYPVKLIFSPASSPILLAIVNFVGFQLKEFFNQSL